MQSVGDRDAGRRPSGIFFAGERIHHAIPLDHKFFVGVGIGGVGRIGLGPSAARRAPAGAAQPTNPAFKTFKEQSSYAVGLDIGKGLKEQAMDVDPTMLARGLTDALAGNKSLLSDREIAVTMQELKKELAVRIAEHNKAEGAAFLAANKKKAGVKTLPSGLQYKVLKQGTGATPKATDIVTTHYRGTLLDGTEFDSSYRRNQPAEFPVDRVIKGWTEALQLMKVGDKWQIYVPSDLAYGPRGAGEDIPPNATLIFDIELLGVKPAPARRRCPRRKNNFGGMRRIVGCP